MTSYLIFVTTSQHNEAVTVAILNIAGIGNVIFGTGDNATNTNCWLIPQSDKKKEELITQLQAIPAILKLKVVRLSKPITAAELAEVRELFTGIGWDSSSITNDELSLYLDTKVGGKFTYYIEPEQRKKSRGLVRIHFRRLQDHPEFSPDWLKEVNYTELASQKKEFTIDDIVVHTFMEFKKNNRDAAAGSPDNPGLKW